MAFKRTNWARQSVSLNTGEVTVGAEVIGGPAIFTYRDDTDAVATIGGADYFAPAAYDLSPGDMIFGSGSDATFAFVVDTVDRDYPYGLTVSSMGLTTSIGNANVANNAAIAFSKLAALPSGEVLIGSAGTVPTATAISGDATLANTGVLSLAATRLKYTTVAVTDAEFNGMYAAPKLLLAAQGANTLISLDKCELVMTYGSANYAGGGVAAIQYDSTINGAGVLASTTLAAATFQAAASTTFTFLESVVAKPFTTTVNKGLYLSNLTGAFTTGDSSFVAHLWYKVIPVV